LNEEEYEGLLPVFFRVKVFRTKGNFKETYNCTHYCTHYAKWGFDALKTHQVKSSTVDQFTQLAELKPSILVHGLYIHQMSQTE